MSNEWIKEYAGYLRGGDVNNNFEKMLYIKAINFPRSFFKYRELTTESLISLSENWLYMSEPSRFNDPFECSLILNHNKALIDIITNKSSDSGVSTVFSESELLKIKNSTDPLAEYIVFLKARGIELPYNKKDQIERLKNHWKKDLVEINNQFRICCFSTSNQEVLLWSLYSQDSKGICIEYDLSQDDDIRPYMQPVLYTDERPTIENLKSLSMAQHIYASICKSTKWEYEKEWRLTYFEPKRIEGKNNRLALPTPKAIYIGPKFEENEQIMKEDLIAIAKRKNIPIYRMLLDDYEYCMQISAKPI